MSAAEHSEETRRFFEAASLLWSSRYNDDPAFEARRRRFIAAVQARLKEPGKILDFGCGSGDIALALAELGHQLTGADVSAAMIAAARTADGDHRAQWIALDGAAKTVPLPFPDATFDAVVASSVLEYVADLRATLLEIAHVLRDGGWLLATVPDLRDPLRRREQWTRRIAAAPGLSRMLEHTRWCEGASYLRISINRFAPCAWQQHLQAAGFVSEDMPPLQGPLLLLAACKQPVVNP